MRAALVAVLLLGLGLAPISVSADERYNTPRTRDGSFFRTARGGASLRAGRVTDELLVRLRDDARAGRALARVGARVLERYPSSGLSLVQLPKDVDLPSAIRTLRDEAGVEAVEPNYILRADDVDAPSDPLFPDQWGLHNTGQTGGTPDADTKALAAWEITTGSPGVVVAVADGGIDYAHPDLAGNVWVNPGEIPGNGLDDDGNGYVDDVHGIDAQAGTGDP